MSLLDEIRAQQGGAGAAAICRTCQGLGWRVGEGATHAQARRCEDCTARCDRCGGAMVVFREDWTGNLISEPCACAHLDARIALYNAAGVPRRYGNVTIEMLEERTPSQKAVKLKLLRSQASFRPGARGVGLSGPVGCGKTHLLAGLVRDLTLHQGVACRFVEFSHLLGEIRAGYSEGRSEMDILGHLVEVPVLVIDELGKGLSTEWQVTILDALISHRYNRAVSTFFATNYPLEAGEGGERRSRENFAQTTLEDRIGSRMMSRLAEMCDLTRMDGPDYRREGGER